MARADNFLVILLATLAGVIGMRAPAHADAVGDFYKGNTVTVITSTGAGGPYDIVARAVARHMPRHIPGNPTMLVKNMPGAGHVLATNFMFNQAAQDGTFIATVYNGIPLHQVLDGKGVRFDAAKFHWLGSTGSSNLVTVVWHTAGVKTIDDVMARQVVAGGTGAGSGTVLYPTVMNNVLGTKFKIVTGYRTSPEIDIAMERGEVQSRSGGSYSGFANEHPDWIKDKKVLILVQVGGDREKDLSDVPLMSELAKNDEQRQVLKLLSSPVALGRPFFTTKKIPDARLGALRQAFDATMKDPDFLTEAKKLNLDLNRINGDKVAEIVRETVNMPPALLARAKAAMEEPVAGQDQNAGQGKAAKSPE
jgi:tripartite-type tricarboxylate transporter receptor subunit TctC